VKRAAVSKSSASPGFLASALSQEGASLATADIPAWLESRRQKHRFSIRRVPLAELASWSFASESGNLVHESGRFFSVEGLRVTTSYPTVSVYHQPIVNQPEIGILGILAKRFDGLLHFLIQAKMEPGNVNLVQLSPTVQATRSNYTKVHGGSAVRYLEYFAERSRGSVLVDQLQSEQGSFFLRKRNRNMIVETTDDVPVHDDFCWLTLGQLKRMLREPNLVNMDTRTVLSAIPLAGTEGELAGLGAGEDFEARLLRSSLARERGLHSNDEIMSWFTELKATAEIRVQSLPLTGLPGWSRDDLSIHRHDRGYFEVIGIAVEADSREVRGWSQPIVRPVSAGTTGFLVQQVAGTLHFLVQARMEPGIFDMFEMAPTVQHIPGSDLPDAPLLDVFASAPAQAVRYAAIQSEEGGRFFHYQNRNIVVELPADQRLAAPRGYIWMTLGQIHEFLRYNNYFNIEARGLIACLGVTSAS
jgi:dTDP-4-dehydro-6-deoxy-alpha-D-glucopyranose 2,3-dehydratase